MASDYMSSRFPTTLLVIALFMSFVLTSCAPTSDVDVVSTPHVTQAIMNNTIKEPTYDKKAYIRVMTLWEGKQKIPIDDTFASRIEEELDGAEQRIRPADFCDSEDEYYGIEIYIHIDDKQYCLIRNDKDSKVIGKYNKECAVVNKLFDDVVERVRNGSNWCELDVDTIINITSVDLEYMDTVIAYTTQYEEIGEIVDIIQHAKRLNGRPKCPYDARLLLNSKDGEVIPVYIATDDCNTMVMGSSSYFEYGSNDKSDQSHILGFFGLESFEDIDHQLMCQSPLKFQIQKFLLNNVPVDTQTVYTYHPTIKEYYDNRDSDIKIEGSFEDTLNDEDIIYISELLSYISIEPAEEGIMEYCNTNNYIRLKFAEDECIKVHAMSEGDIIIAFKSNKAEDSSWQYGTSNGGELYKCLLDMAGAETFSLNQFKDIKSIAIRYRNKDQKKNEEEKEYTEVKVKDKEIIRKIEMALCESSIPTMVYPSREDADCIIRTSNGELYFKMKGNFESAFSEPTIIVNGTYWFDNEAFYRVLDEYKLIDQSTVASQG